MPPDDGLPQGLPSTSHAIIDLQHQALFEAAQQLLTHDVNDHDRATVLDDYRQFRCLTLANFQYEELAMEQCTDPLAEEHRKAHQRIQEQIDDVFNDAASFSDLIAVVRTVMNNWLPNHIDRYDMALIERLEGQRE